MTSHKRAAGDGQLATGNRRRTFRAFALLAASFGLAACGPTDPADQEGATEATERATTATPGSSLRRFITNHPKGCGMTPPLPWIARPLFQYPNVKTPPGLKGYCLYKFNSTADPTQSDVSKLKTYVLSEIGAFIEEDTVVTGPLGFEQDSRASLHDALLMHAGAMVDGLPKGSKPIDTIRIAFPDSSPEETSGVIPRGVMLHGSVLAWLAQDLANPSNPYAQVNAAHVATGLALPQIDNDKEESKGGFYGTRGQLAEAIYRVTAAWISDGWTVPTPQPRLVVNLSVGWEPTDGCADAQNESQLLVQARAVFDAVSHASCLGGLVIAAAGNDPGHNKNEEPAKGPTCPAAWSTNFEAPNAGQCEALMGSGYEVALPMKLPIPAQSPPAPGIANPLLYPVGGVDFARRPLAVTRPGGLPKYVAISSHASAGPPGKELPPTLTGTSVGTAIASAIAATTWAYRPELTAPELMQLVYEAGTPLDVYPEFGPNAQGDTVHALSLCHALMRACSAGAGVPPRCPDEGVKCPELPKPEERSNPPLSPNLMAQLEALFPQPIPIVDVPSHPELLSNTPPNEEFRNAAIPPWVFPQPLYPPCGACGIQITSDISGRMRLYVSVNPRFDGTLVLSNTTLILDTGTSRPTTVGPLGSGTLTAGQSYAVELDGVPISGNVLGAQIAWLSRSATLTTSSVTETILVTR